MRMHHRTQELENPWQTTGKYAPDIMPNAMFDACRILVFALSQRRCSNCSIHVFAVSVADLSARAALVTSETAATTRTHKNYQLLLLLLLRRHSKELNFHGRRLDSRSNRTAD